MRCFGRGATEPGPRGTTPKRSRRTCSRESGRKKVRDFPSVAASGHLCFTPAPLLTPPAPPPSLLQVPDEPVKGARITRAAGLTQNHHSHNGHGHHTFPPSSQASARDSNELFMGGMRSGGLPELTSNLSMLNTLTLSHPAAWSHLQNLSAELNGACTRVHTRAVGKLFVVPAGALPVPVSDRPV
jgi:hypothetical protein